MLTSHDLPTDEHRAATAPVLDNFYVGTRYANGHPEGPPLAHYSPIQSNQAIQYANEILAFARDEMA